MCFRRPRGLCALCRILFERAYAVPAHHAHRGSMDDSSPVAVRVACGCTVGVGVDGGWSVSVSVSVSVRFKVAWDTWLAIFGFEIVWPPKHHRLDYPPVNVFDVASSPRCLGANTGRRRTMFCSMLQRYSSQKSMVIEWYSFFYLRPGLLWIYRQDFRTLLQSHPGRALNSAV